MIFWAKSIERSPINNYQFHGIPVFTIHRKIPSWGEGLVGGAIGDDFGGDGLFVGADVAFADSFAWLSIGAAGILRDHPVFQGV